MTHGITDACRGDCQIRSHTGRVVASGIIEGHQRVQQGHVSILIHEGCFVVDASAQVRYPSAATTTGR
jgi:hypothetical protein